MLVVKKRIVIFVLVLLCVAIFVTLMVDFDEYQSLECFTPATNKRVIVDFGHGIPDRRHKFKKWCL